MSARKNYTAIYEHDTTDDAWNVRIDGIDGCQTYGRSLRQAQSRIREALALWLQRDADALVIHDQLPKALAVVAERATRARTEADRAGMHAMEQTARAAKQLTDLGLSRRDTSELLGLSHQRIQQLLEVS